MNTPTQPPQITEADEKAAEEYANAVFLDCDDHHERFHARVAYKQGILHERKRTQEIVEVMRKHKSIWHSGECMAECKLVCEALAKYEAWKAGG